LELPASSRGKRWYCHIARKVGDSRTGMDAAVGGE
jgi:hypothetical protein